MKKGFRTLLCAAAVSLSLTSAVPVFANEVVSSPVSTVATPDVNVQKDLNKVNFTLPFTETKQYSDSKGNEYTVTNTFTPIKSSISTQGTESNQAYTGTWTSKVTYGISTMSYRFDLTKTGSQFQITNARNQEYWGLFTQFADPSLTITRGTSTASFPAEINSSVTAKMFDNAWVPLGSSRWIAYTTVTSSGWMTLTWN
ncbi:hypothetical protein [Paenibacillus hunanensis]|uniref:WxL domain-containing protein n=1 Tax=Paenibacillus hunanensis TaxID=539262 RepID=A0ABU1IW70_9BACL|nr:hypothetical protein [Paenibacillus hunanensis]MDR6243513.1 hypothetical protein [Paenibacillus hunanensis]GGI98299.1 hypothetical protein GCM10008022_03760 [Paenibacillus hunanensis]